MMELTEANIMRAYEIYRENAKINAISLDLTMEMLGLVNTKAVDTASIGNTPGYWEFLYAILRNIETGKWNTYPTLWFDYYLASKTTDLIQYQMDKKKAEYLDLRKRLCERLNLSNGYLQDKELVMHWVRNKNGERDIMEVLYTIVKMYLDYTNSTITGKTKQLGTVMVSFNTANQAKPPIVGVNKQDVMKNHFQSKLAKYV